ncbi:MAG TPA: O-antigen ligase family protein, partial [Myxococcaceae bacterium]|nr:O-antigen ligase family protein [Myxococcaceae bacterium]
LVLAMPGWGNGEQGGPSGALERGWLVGFWPVGLFVLWALAAPSLAGHVPSATGIAQTLEWLAIPVAATAWSRMDGRGRAIVVGAVAATLLVSCAVAGLQHFGVWPPPDAFEPFRFTRIPFQRVYEPVPGMEGRFMGGGLAFHRLKFAHIGGLAALGLLVGGLRSRGRLRGLLLACAFAGIVSIAVFPYARAASAALLIAGVVAGVIASSRKRAAFAVGAALAAAALLLLASIAPLRERFLSSITPAGSGDRQVLLASGVAVVHSHPWTGIGPGNFRAMDHVGPDAADHLRTQPGKAHNQFLSMATEAGIPGALFFCAMLIGLARWMSGSSAPGAFGLSALVFFVLLSMVHDPLFQASFSMALILALGIGCARRVEPA